MRYSVLIVLFCGLKHCLQMRLSDNICYDSSRFQHYVCCFNYEMVNGKCTECKNGTTTEPGARCVPCKNNTFGHKCIAKCLCNQFQRCDPEVGCIIKTRISKLSTTYIVTSEPELLLNETVATTETHVIRSGKAITEWIILTLCITGCFILTGLGCLICTNRKRLPFKLRITAAEVIIEPLEPSPYIGIYDEVDENQLSFNRIDLNFTSQEPHYETVDLVPLERPSTTTSTEQDNTGYLDPCFAMEDDEIHRLKYQTSHEECCSTTSSISDVVDTDNTAYNNLYQPLQENWQDGSHGYEVPVMVHKCTNSSARVDEKSTSNSYYNVYKPLQKDWDMNCPAYENQKSPEKKAGTDKNLFGDACASVITTGKLHDYINMHAESKISINTCDEIVSCKPLDEDNVKKIDQKSFSGDY